MVRGGRSKPLVKKTTTAWGRPGTKVSEDTLASKEGMLLGKAKPMQHVAHALHLTLPSFCRAGGSASGELELLD